MLKPDVSGSVEKEQYNQQRFKQSDRKCEFSNGDVVYAKDYRRGTNNRSEAIIVEQKSPVSYLIKFSDGYITKRHKNQIITTQIEAILTRGENMVNSDSSSQQKSCEKVHISKSKNKKQSNEVNSGEQKACRRSARLAEKCQN